MDSIYRPDRFDNRFESRYRRTLAAGLADAGETVVINVAPGCAGKPVFR